MSKDDSVRVDHERVIIYLGGTDIMVCVNLDPAKPDLVTVNRGHGAPGGPRFYTEVIKR
jgi:hypothetical protein